MKMEKSSMMFRLISISWLMCVAPALLGQLDMAYLRHLSQHRLQTEHRVYLNRLEGKVSPDSLQYYRLKFALQYRDREQFDQGQPQYNALFQSDSSAMLLTALWYLDDAYRPAYPHLQWLGASPYASVREVTRVFVAGEERQAPNAAANWPQDLGESWSNMQNYQTKKPWKAALLSAALPGSGKWYAGRPRAAMVNTLGLTLFALQALETHRQLGPKHPLSIANFVVFGVFYGGNIVGSAKAVKVRGTELRNIFFKDAAFYYRRMYKPLLY